LDRTEYWLPNVSYVFHGRDIFSPVAAHLANLVPLSNLGTPFTDPGASSFPRLSDGEWLARQVDPY